MGSINLRSILTTLILHLVMICALSGCSGNPRPILSGDSDPLPDPHEVVSTWNERAERMDRLWGRVAVTFRFTDEDGKRRFEQGEGHFQRRDGSDLALSVGKLSEIMLWIGADDSRYWLIQRLDGNRVWFGKHETYTRTKGQSLGLPIAPRELLMLMGISPFPIEADVAIARDSSGDLVLTVGESLGAERPSGIWRVRLNPISRLPSTIELLDDQGESILHAEHTMVTPTIVRYEQSSAFDHIAQAIRITYPRDDASIAINFSAELTDSTRTGRLRDSAFDLDVLTDLLGPMDEIIDLDTPANSESVGFMTE